MAQNEPVLKDWLILAGLCVLIFILNIDYTAVNLAMVPISREIDTDLNQLQWLLSAYVLTWAALVIPGGRCADLYGKKKMLLLGLGIFVLGSWIAGTGNRIEVLIAGRIIQGMGGALFSPACYGLIFAIMPTHRQGFAIGLFGSAAGFGLAAGPSLAGFILDHISWRWIFYLNIPLGLLAFLILFLLVPRDFKNATAEKIDPVAVGLLSTGLILAMFGLNQIEVWGFQDIRLWALFATSLGLLSLFNWWDNKQTVQTLPRPLLRNAPFLSTVGGVFFMSFNFSMILVLMGLYIQGVQRFSNGQSGLIFLAMTLIIGILSPIGGKLADHFNVRLPILWGSLLMAAAAVLLSFLKVDSSLIYLLVCLFGAGLGLGLCFPTINTALLRTVKQEEINTASGIFTTGMMLGNTLGVIVPTSLLVLLGEKKLLSLLNTEGLSLSLDSSNKLLKILAKADHSAVQFADFSSLQVPQLMKVVDESFMAGFWPNMLMGAVFALAGGLWMWRQLEPSTAVKTDI